MTYEEFQRRIGKSSLKINDSAGRMKMNPASISNNKTRRVLWHLTVIAVLQSETAERVIDSRGTLASVDPTVQQCERIRRRIYATSEEGRQDVFDYIEMLYNPKRRHGYEQPALPSRLRKAVLREAGECLGI